jgi:hypothetical protein
LISSRVAHSVPSNRLSNLNGSVGASIGDYTWFLSDSIFSFSYRGFAFGEFLKDVALNSYSRSWDLKITFASSTY